MSVITNATNQSAAIISDAPQKTRSINEIFKTDIREKTNAFVDAIEPHVATTLKAISTFAVGEGVNAIGEASKTSIGASYPILSPCVNIAVDTSTDLVVECIDPIVSPIVDYSVEKSSGVAKEAIGKSIDTTVDTSAYSFSLFENKT